MSLRSSLFSPETGRNHFPFDFRLWPRNAGVLVSVRVVLLEFAVLPLTVRTWLLCPKTPRLVCCHQSLLRRFFLVLLGECLFSSTWRLMDTLTLTAMVVLSSLLTELWVSLYDYPSSHGPRPVIVDVFETLP